MVQRNGVRDGDGNGHGDRAGQNKSVWGMCVYVCIILRIKMRVHLHE